MMLAFRRWLGRLQARLENRAVTLASGERGGSPGPSEALSEADEAMLVGWITGKVDDHALFAHASARADGLALLARACAVRSGNPHVWSARSQMCLEQGDLAAAIEHVEHAYVLGPFEPAVSLLLVQVLAAAGRRDDALRIVPLALQNAKRRSAHAIRLQVCRAWEGLEPESIEPRLEIARTHVAAGALDEAIAEFERLLAVHGPRADLLLPLGAVYQDLVRLEDAQRIYLQAMHANPDNADALCMAGVCARDLRDADLADRCLSRALELDPGSAVTQYNLGLLRFDQGRQAEAVHLLHGARAAGRGDPWQVDELARILAQPVERDIADPDWANARFKLNHDIEQLEYLLACGRVGPLITPVIAECRAALGDALLPVEEQRMVALSPQRYPLLARVYKAPLYAPDPAPPQGPLVNPDLLWRQIEESYLDASPSLIVIDALLSADALAAIRAYCLESTIWNDLKGGYLGANMHDGFSGRLLLGIAAELRARMPRVLGDHPLQTMWAYKYDSRYTGIGVHADVAAVNVNFWITPDDANLDPDTGGLLVYAHDAPKDWDFHRFNRDPPEIYRYLESMGSSKVKVPYKQNRAVIFDSDLFHETDAFSFRPGYTNRRVNVTMLYGTRAG